MKTKPDIRRMEGFRKRCGFFNGIDVPAACLRGVLSFLEGDDVSNTLRSFSANHIDVECSVTEQNKVWQFTRFYEAPYASGREDVWGILHSRTF